MMEPDIASRVALRIAVCSRLLETDPLGRFPRHIIEAMRRRILVEIDEAVRLHNEVFPRQPYHERTA